MICLKLLSITGYRCDIENGVHFLDEHILVYPAGNIYVLHDIQNNTQQFLTDKNLNKVTHASLDFENKMLALTVPGKRRSFITLFDLNTTERLGSLSCDQMISKTFVSVVFSPDGKHIIGQGSAPDWKIVLWDWERNDVICAYDPLNLKEQSEVYQISFHPKDPNLVCSVGKRILRTYRISGGNFKQYIFQKYEDMEIIYFCHVWFSKSKIAVGTSDGRIIILENNEELDEIKVTDENCQDPERGGIARRKTIDRVLITDRPINQLVATNKHLLVLWGHQAVIIYKIEEGSINHVPIGIIVLPSEFTNSEADTNIISSLVISPKGCLVVVDTKSGQLYSFNLSEANWENCYCQNFTYLLYPNPRGGIQDMDLCVQKPFLAVCTSNFIYLWDYRIQTLELQNHIYQQLHSIAIHPSGNYIVAGCSDYLRYYAVFLKELKILREYSIRESNKCSFSKGGHLFAATSGYVIHIYSSITLELLKKLKGHFGEVSAVEWIESDNQLISCGKDGAVYTWDINTATRIHDIVIKCCSYNDMNVEGNGKRIYVMSCDKTIKEIYNSKVVNDLSCDVTMTSCISTLSEKKIYFGSTDGNIYVEELPLKSSLKNDNIVGHYGPVIKMKLSYDGTTLITSGEDGTLCFWQVEDDMTRMQPIVMATLITKDEFLEKANRIDELENFVEDMKIDKAYQLKQKDKQHEKRILELNALHEQEVKTLKNNIQELQQKVIEINKKHNMEISDLIEKNHHSLEEQKEEYINKLVTEYERLEKVKLEAQLEYDKYENSAKAQSQDFQYQSEEKNICYERKLSEVKTELEQMKNILNEKEEEWNFYIQGMENDADEEILEIRTCYESQLKEKKEAILLYKTELCIMRHKISSLKSKIEHCQNHIEKQEQETEQLKSTIKEQLDEETVLQNEIGNRHQDMLLKEKKLIAVQKKSDNLEKHNFVLNEMLKETKNQLELMKEDKIKLEAKIKQNDEEHLEMDLSVNKMKLQVKELKKKLVITEQDMKKEKQKRNRELRKEVSQVRKDENLSSKRNLPKKRSVSCQKM